MTTYALMGVLLAGYLAFLAVRGPSGNSLLVSGWGAASFELAAGALCLARGVTQRPGRAVALTLGFAITSWALGDFALTAESLGGASPPTPSLADVFYLGFYPLAYVAVVLFIRGDTQRLTTPSWLDGAVASVGTAAVCAAFVFERVLRLTGRESRRDGDQPGLPDRGRAAAQPGHGRIDGDVRQAEGTVAPHGHGNRYQRRR